MLIRLSALVLLSSSAVPSQSFITSPTGMLTTEGDSFAHRFANSANWRSMFLDGELRGTRRTLKAIAFRPNYQQHATSRLANSARSWQTVTIDLCDTDAKRASPTFSNNILATPTRVFRAVVRWPALSGTPPTRPAAWSLRLPFRQNWVYTGTRDLCIDFQFAGGTTHWQSQNYPLANATYSLDGHLATGGNFRTRTISSSKRCKESTQSRFALNLSRAETQQFRQSTWLTIMSSTQFTGSQPIAHAVSATHHAAGLRFPGVTCQSLFITNPLAVAVAKPSAYWSTHLFALVPHSPRYVGIKLYFQAGFNDSRSGLPLLTPAVESTVMPPPRGPFERVTVNAPLLNNTGFVSTSFALLPLIRFAY